MDGNGGIDLLIMHCAVEYSTNGFRKKVNYARYYYMRPFSLPRQHFRSECERRRTLKKCTQFQTASLAEDFASFTSTSLAYLLLGYESLLNVSLRLSSRYNLRLFSIN